MRRYRKMIVTFFLPAAALLGTATLLSSCAHGTVSKHPAEETSVPMTADDEQRTAVRTVAAEPQNFGVVPVSPEVNGVTQAANAPVLVDPTATERLTDGKIIAVTHVADEGEIEQAKLAMRRATDPRVRAYAEELLHDHQEADQRGERIAAADNLQPANSATSDKLKRDAAKTYEQIALKEGVDLDRAYVTAQVEQHSAVLRLFDERLIPQATDQNVKAELEHMRPALAKHLEQALTLQTKLKE